MHLPAAAAEAGTAVAGTAHESRHTPTNNVLASQEQQHVTRHIFPVNVDHCLHCSLHVI
jgi:hypothetical protein